MSFPSKILLLAIAGAIGTVSRYGLSGVVQKIAGSGFPWGTLVVNSSGCFLFGLVWALSEGRIITPETRIIILIGFMGSFTTFSSFAFETGEFLRDGQFLYAFGNILAQNISGILIFFTGLFLGRLFT